MRRDTVQYHRGNTLSTLPLLLHELGHAWGLCDAYLPPKDWCHPVGNLRTATEQSIMDLDPPRQQLFLSDVDIEAIQSHARQMGVADERRFRAAAPVRSKAIPLCVLDRADRNGDTLEVRGGWVAMKPAKVSVHLQSESVAVSSPKEIGAEAWATGDGEGEHLGNTWRLSIGALRGKAHVTLVVRATDGGDVCRASVTEP